MNILDFIKRIIVVDDDVDTAKFPQELLNITIEKVSDNIDILLKRILEFQKQEHILVATNNTAVKNLISALNMNFQKNKISIIYEYSVDTSELETELESLTLYTETGEKYFPEETDINNIFSSDDRILIKGNSANKGTELFSTSGQLWGTLLNKEYRFSNICGTVLSHTDKISIKEKAQLMLNLMEENNSEIYSLADILLLSDDNKNKRFIFLPGAVRNSSPAETELEIFIGLNIKEDTNVIIAKMIGLPAVLVEDINITIMNKKYNAIQLLTNDIIRNTMQRICLTD